MSTRSIFPLPPSCALRKCTSLTHSGQSPSNNTRTSHDGSLFHGGSAAVEDEEVVVVASDVAAEEAEVVASERR